MSSGGDEGILTSLGHHQKSSFSPLERLLVLREVQLLRFIDTEFLPFLAQIASETRLAPGERVCLQGQPTNGNLIVVAHGRLQLHRVPRPHERPIEHRDLRPGDTLGNTTALLSDSSWRFTATAVEDSWTLTIDARDLSDVLRGRAELAHALLRGYFYTFNRRLKQIVESGGSVKREWMLAADVDKSPAIKGRGSHLGAFGSREKADAVFKL